MRPKLDPRARAAVDFLRAASKEYRGPIIPNWLSRVLPLTGPKRTWRDYVAIYILADVLGAHRVYKDGEPFFSRPLYRIDREKWAREIPTTLKQVSLTLSWLAEDVKVIGRLIRSITKDGKPCGRETLVWPIMGRFCDLIDHLEEHGQAVVCPMPKKRRPEKPSEDGLARGCQGGNLAPLGKATSPTQTEQLGPPSKGNFSLNSATTPNTAEGGDESRAQRQEQNASGDRSRGISAFDAEDRDRQGASDGDTRAEPAPCASDSSDATENGANGQPTITATPFWSPPPPPVAIKVVTDDEKKAWRKAMRFAALWQEAIVRSGNVSASIFTLADKKAAFQ